MTENFQNIDQIITEKGSTKKSLIPILQAIQSEYNFLPEDVLRYVSEKTSITHTWYGDEYFAYCSDERLLVGSGSGGSLTRYLRVGATLGNTANGNYTISFTETDVK